MPGFVGTITGIRPYGRCHREPRLTPKQAEALKQSEGKRGWISARDIEAFYSTQEVAQLYRDAPALSRTRVKVPKAEDLRPLARMQADSISLKGLPSGRYTGVINLIDIFSQYSWQIPVQTVGSASEDFVKANQYCRCSNEGPLISVVDAR